MDFGPDFRSDLKGFRPYSRDFTSDFEVLKPDFRDVCSDFTDIRLDFRDLRSDFRTFLHRISEVVGPLVLDKRTGQTLGYLKVTFHNF